MNPLFIAFSNSLTALGLCLVIGYVCRRSELEKFILEFGKGFAFVERQKRMIIDGRDNKLDLLLLDFS